MTHRHWLQVHPGQKEVRATDVAKISWDIHHLIGGLDKTLKVARGFHHETFGRLMTPAGLDFSE